MKTSSIMFRGGQFSINATIMYCDYKFNYEMVAATTFPHNTASISVHSYKGRTKGSDRYSWTIG